MDEKPESDSETLGGSGGRNARAESGMTEIRDARLTGLAVRNNWMMGQRFATDATIDDLTARMRERGGKLNMKEQACLTTINGLLSNDERIAQIAVKNVIAMEAKNMEDERPDREVSDGLTVNVGVAVSGEKVAVVEDDNWYGNDAHIKQARILNNGSNGNGHSGNGHA